jgi:hypothetical protein
MTHGPPQYILDRTFDGRAGGCPHLARAIARVTPKLHVFGHVHNGYGAQRIEQPTCEATNDELGMLPAEFVGVNQSKRRGFAALSPGSAEQWKTAGQTLYLNAALVGNEGLINWPWKVEMELPVVEEELKQKDKTRI